MYKFHTLALLALTSALSVSSAVVAGDRSSDAPIAVPSSTVAPGVTALCQEQLKTQRVSVTKPLANNGIRLDNVPPACMTIADAIVNGVEVDGPPPTQLDGDGIQYDNLDDDEYEFLSATFDRWVASQSNLIKRHLESNN